MRTMDGAAPALSETLVAPMLATIKIRTLTGAAKDRFLDPPPVTRTRLFH
jgi:hypothetical protein